MNGEQADILAALQAIQRRLDSSSDKKKVAKPELKGAGNKEQYEFCDKIGELIDTALDATNTEDVAAASIALTEAKTEVAKRQKLIKIADRSAQGWQTVKEYVRDDLCDGSDDEKRLKKAEKEAEKKKDKLATTRKLARASNRSRSFAPYSLPQRGNFRRFGPIPSSFGYPYRVDNRPCFQCGITGHIRVNCPALRAARQQQQRGQPPIPGVTQRGPTV